MANKFWVGGTGTWDATTLTNWSLISGGVGGAPVPTSTDAVFIDGNSGTGTITLGVGVDVAALDFTGYTGTYNGGAFVVGINSTTVGTCTLSTGMTVTAISVTYRSNAVGTVTSNGKTFTALVVGGGSGAGVTTLAGTTTVGIITLNSGTLDTNGQTCNWTTFASAGTATRTLTMGASTINISGSATSWNCATTTNLTVNVGTSTVVFNGATTTVSNGVTGTAKNFNNVIINGAGTFSWASASTASTIANLTINSTALALIPGGNFPTITGAFTVNGTAASPITILSGALAVARPISAGSVSLSNVNFRDITAAGAAIPWSGIQLGNCLGNSNITFTTAVTRYWSNQSLSSGNFSDTNRWAATTGGTTGASVPLPQDTCIFDASSFTGNTKTVVMDILHVGTMDWSAVIRTGIVFSLGVTVAFYGSLSGAGNNSSVTGMGGAGSFNFFGRSSLTLSKVWSAVASSNMTFNAPGGTYTLQGDVGATIGGNSWYGALTLSSGTLDLNGFVFNIRTFVNNVAGTRSLLFSSTGVLSINSSTSGSNFSTLSTGFTTDGLGTILIRQVQPTGVTFTFAGGNVTYGTLQHTVAASVGSVTITGNNSFQDILYSDATNARTLTLAAGITTTIRAPHGLQSVNGTSGKLISVVSNTSGTPASFDFPNGYGGGSDFLSVQDITATTNPWYAGVNSTNVSGNTNVIFTAPPSATGGKYLALGIS